MRFQHDVWKELTDAFLDRLDIQPGWNCLDVGAGPGFVTADLRERIGESGSVTALEPSEHFETHLKALVKAEGWENVRIHRSRVEDARLRPGSFDLIFVRWVLNFVPDRKTFLAKLAELLRPGGVIAVMDYWYEGLSVLPKGTPFDRLPDIARLYYRSGGGDAYGIADMPAILKAKGFDPQEFTPLQMAGGPESGVYRWASQFFREHLPLMAEKDVISQEERDAQLKNFSDLDQNPDMIFFSPIVVACAMKKHNH